MKFSKKIVLIASVLAIFQISIYAKGSKKPATNTVTDVTGREVTLPTTITKIVATQPSDVEILYALEAGEMLVGRGSYCDYPAEVTAIADVGSGKTFSIEHLIALEPDVVIMGTMAQTVEQVEALESAGITVIATNATNIEGVYKTITLIGTIVNNEDAANMLITSMKDSFTAIADKAKSNADYNTDKTVYFEVSPLQWGLWTAGSDTFMNELASLCGVTNAFADTKGWASISEEQVLARNPDFIVTTAMYYGDGPKPVDEITSRKGWNNLQAVTNAHVYNADANTTSRPGPRLVDAANQLYTFFYSK